MVENLSVSAVILTQNEQTTIERCLKSVLFCSEIILIDNSTDKTLEIARQIVSQDKLRLIKNIESNDFSKLRNLGLQVATNPWVLFVDADEEIPVELAAEIHIAVRQRGVNGYYISRRDFFLGRWLKWGETRNIKHLKLGKKTAGKWQRPVHEKWQVQGQVRELINPLNHYPHPTIVEFLAHINRWTTLDAQVFTNQGEKSSWWKIIAYPTGKFLVNYFVRLGLLDGMPGLFMALMMSFHSFLTRGKMFLLQER